MKSNWVYTEIGGIPNEEGDFLLCFQNTETGKILTRIGRVTQYGGIPKPSLEVFYRSDDVPHKFYINKLFAYQKIYVAKTKIEWSKITPSEKFKVLHRNRWKVMSFSHYDPPHAYFYDSSYFSLNKKLYGFSINDIKRINE